MINFKKDTWLYALIAGILALIAIFTPIGSIESAGTTIYSWFGGHITYMGDGGDAWSGTATITLYLLGVTCISTVLLLFYSIHSWRGKEFKWDWLVYLLSGIALIIFTILFFVYDFPEDAIIGYSPIGTLSAGILAMVASILDKFFTGRAGTPTA